jgi:hypothetical protein
MKIPHLQRHWSLQKVFVRRFTSNISCFVNINFFRKTTPPEPYNVDCKGECEGRDLHGPFGWCHVELFEVKVKYEREK